MSRIHIWRLMDKVHRTAAQQMNECGIPAKKIKLTIKDKIYRWQRE